MMRALDRKLVRDLWQIRGQVLAICLVVAAGVGTFVMSLTALGSLERALQAYYDRNGFAHVFAHLTRAPLSLTQRMRTIPGVGAVDPRIVHEVTLDVPGMSEPARGRLVSVPEQGPAGLNRVHLRRGRQLTPGRSDEALLSESFAEAHGLQPGDRLFLIINGRRQRVTIAGIALSPEFLIAVPPGSLLPDDLRFGILWMSQAGLAAALDMEGAFNDVSLTLMRGASEREVIRRLDALTDSYGGTGAYGRGDHLSHQYISDEMRQLRSMGLLFPTIFLLVSAFLLQVVLSRLVGTQREQIAALKAFGYSRREVAVHYLKMVLAVPLLGTAAGTVLGAWMGHSVTQLYLRFYRFPVMEYRVEPDAVLWALLLSMAAATLGTLGAVRRASRLPPAEAMRPEPPPRYRPTIIERLGWAAWLPQVTRMILRNLERRPVRALLASLGIATALAVLIVGSFSLDAINYVMDFQFRLAQRQDMTVTFVEATHPRGVHELRHLTGLQRLEPFRAVPVRLVAEHRRRRTSIMGLDHGGQLFRLIDSQERVVPLPISGLLLSSKLAALLEVAPGDRLVVETLEGKRRRAEVEVQALITEYSGLNAYMERSALNRLMREGEVASGAFLSVDAAHRDRLYGELKQTPGVAGISLQKAMLASFEQTVAENLLMMRTINIAFAIVLAFGVVYNTARISLAESSRELSTLRVIGFSRWEVSTILLGELAVLTVVAIPLGWLLGYALAGMVTLGLDTEIYRIPLVVERGTFAFSAAVVVTGTALSAWIVRRRLDQLDLIGVLKSKG